MKQALLIKSGRGLFECLILENKEIVSAKALGKLLKEVEGLVVGDYVSLAQDSGQYEIVERRERANAIKRYSPRDNKNRSLVANVDVMCIVVSLSLPVYKGFLVDRYLVRSIEWEIHPIIIFNKSDEYQEVDSWDLELEKEKFKNLEIEVFEVSAKNPETLNVLKTTLQDKTVIFMGQSGVGKSKLINALVGTHFYESEVLTSNNELKSGDLGKIGKGTHTTTWAQLIYTKDFYLVDSPGIRSFSLQDIEAKMLINYFPDLLELQQNCQYPNCSHEEKNRGCYFYTEQFAEEPLYIQDRFFNFLKIRDEINNNYSDR